MLAEAEAKVHTQTDVQFAPYGAAAVGEFLCSGLSCLRPSNSLSSPPPPKKYPSTASYHLRGHPVRAIRGFSCQEEPLGGGICYAFICFAMLCFALCTKCT